MLFCEQSSHSGEGAETPIRLYSASSDGAVSDRLLKTILGSDYNGEEAQTPRTLPTIAVIGFSLFALPSGAAQAANLTPEEASTHVGRVETVCGIVASAHYAERTHSQPTFLNLGEPYPNQVFTAVIFGSDRAKFGQPETLQGKNICVSGKIELYRGKPEIILHDHGQLQEE